MRPRRITASLTSATISKRLPPKPVWRKDRRVPRQADGRYAWVVVGANAEAITFERDVVWSEGMSRRLTQQLLQ